MQRYPSSLIACKLDCCNDLTEPDNAPLPAAQKGQSQAAAAPAAAPLSALDDLLGLSSALDSPAPAAAQPAGFALEPRPSLTPALFQGKWGALQPAQRITLALPPSALAAIEANGHQVPPHLLSHTLQCSLRCRPGAEDCQTHADPESQIQDL